MIALRRAVPSDAPALSETLADAFNGDPVWDWMLPPGSHRARLRRIFGRLLGYALPRGHVYATEDLTTVTMWSPPGEWKLPLSAVLRSAVPMARAAGVRLPRLLGRLNDIERVHATQPDPHWYLEFIGTARERQGHGAGAALLVDALDRFDALGLPTYLESSNPRNLPFYQRHGFTVTAELSFRSGPPQWTLWRDPR
jgi:ribosomal protein S18 acetylase RimI-like enzyme